VLEMGVVVKPSRVTSASRSSASTVRSGVAKGCAAKPETWALGHASGSSGGAVAWPGAGEEG